METAEVPATQWFLLFFINMYPVYPLKNKRDPFRSHYHHACRPTHHIIIIQLPDFLLKNSGDTGYSGDRSINQLILFPLFRIHSDF